MALTKLGVQEKIGTACQKALRRIRAFCFGVPGLMDEYFLEDVSHSTASDGGAACMITFGPGVEGIGWDNGRKWKMNLDDHGLRILSCNQPFKMVLLLL